MKCVAYTLAYNIYNFRLLSMMSECNFTETRVKIMSNNHSQVQTHTDISYIQV